MSGAVIGLIMATLGLGLVTNFRRIADQFADYAAARPRPPSWLKGNVTDARTIRLIGGIFLAIGVLAVGAAIHGLLL